MVTKTLRMLSAVALLCAVAAPALATSLEIMPVMVSVPAPAAASTVTLLNSGTDKINAQVRVFKWTQVGGKDQLAPTHDVVASPPAIRLQAGKKGVIRIVRLSKTPVQGEETYRLLIDEVPKAPKTGKTGVGISVRYSLPVFFAAAGAAPELHWSAGVSGGKLVISAKNTGALHMRLADLQIESAGKVVTVAQGLSGYVLGSSTRTWAIKAGNVSAAAGSTIKILAKGDNGAIEATVKVGAGN